MGQPAAELIAVRAGYRGRTAVDDVSFVVDDGITVVVGANGGGKSTLLKLIATVLAPTAGTVRVVGHDVSRSRPRGAARRSIGYLEQDARLPSEMRVVDALRYVTWLFRIAAGRRDVAIDMALDRFDLRPHERDRLATLSGGTHQRLMLAATSIHRPRLLILDEPTAGVDPSHRTVIQSLFAADPPAPAVVMSTHHLDDIAAFADRVLVVTDGSIGFDGSLAELESAGERSGDRMQAIQSGLARFGGKALARSVGD
jgi:ABC-2 type transport system ATP-binding protein